MVRNVIPSMARAHVHQVGMVAPVRRPVPPVILAKDVTRNANVLMERRVIQCTARVRVLLVGEVETALAPVHLAFLAPNVLILVAVVITWTYRVTT